MIGITFLTKQNFVQNTEEFAVFMLNTSLTTDELIVHFSPVAGEGGGGGGGITTKRGSFRDQVILVNFGV